MDVLTTIVTFGERMNIHEIASALSVDQHMVEDVVKLGPNSMLFNVEEHRVTFSTQTLCAFLLDSDRSGAFFIPAERRDAHLIQIMSRHTASDPLNPRSRDCLLDILAIILPNTDPVPEIPLTAHRIAASLQVELGLVEHVVQLGAAKSLFRVDHLEQVQPSTPYLKYFLQDPSRSGEFFVSDRRLDPLFTRILSQNPPSDPYSHSHSHNTLMNVLTVVVALRGMLHIHEIASVLDVEYTVVERIVKLGPTKGLFWDEEGQIEPSTGLLRSFLEDVNRSGEFCVTERRDGLCLRTLSQQLAPSNPSLSYSRDILTDILAVMVSFQYGLSVFRVASALDVDPQIVEKAVLKLGPSGRIFQGRYIALLSKYLTPTLTNADRSGEFFLSRERIDAVFIQILSRKPPAQTSHSYSRCILMGVLAAIANINPLNRAWSATRLAAFLAISPALVEAVVRSCPASLFFVEADNGTVAFSTPLLEPFLKDAKRSGEFFISDTAIDPFFNRILSSPRPLAAPAGPQSGYQDVLKEVLAMILVAGGESLGVSAIAAALDVHPILVDRVVELGSTRSLFTMCSYFAGKYSFSTSSFGDFLRDAKRSEEFYISDATIDRLLIRTLSLPPPPTFPTSIPKTCF